MCTQILPVALNMVSHHFHALVLLTDDSNLQEIEFDRPSLNLLRGP